MLTPLQERILQFITRHLAEQGHSPTLIEIGTAVGINSKGTTHRYVEALIKKGHLQRNPRGWRGLRLAGEQVRGILPLLGRIAAGCPIAAIQDQDELDPAELFAGNNRYVLQVQGDSMIDIGILDGDYVVIQQQDNADDGDIVVALVDQEEATLKRLRQPDKKTIELIPENSTMQTMHYDASRITIQGVLVGQMRSY